MKSTDYWFRVRQTPSGPQTEGTAKCFLGHKIDSGPGKDPDGVFAEWNWDGERLFARTDYYGMMPIFYYARDGEVAVSTSLVRLIAEGAPADLDCPAIAAFLRLSTFIGDDTPFKHIRMLPQHGELKWDAGRLTVTGGVPLIREQTLSAEQAIDGVIALFSQSIRRRHPAGGRVAIPLSGGHDSRHILLELCKQGVKPALCVTVEQDDEADIARIVADALGIPQTVLRFDEGWFRNEVRKDVLSHFTSAELVEFMCLGDFLLRNRTDVSYDGIAGDMLLEGPALKVTERRSVETRSPDELAEAYFNFYGPIEESLDRLLGPEYRESMDRRVAVERFVREWTRHGESHNPHTSFYFWARTRRHAGMSPYGMLSGVPTVFSPYLDRDFFEFMFSLPTEIVLSRVLQDGAMARAYPEYAHLPYASESRDRKGRLWKRLLNMWDQARFILCRNPRQLRRYIEGLTIRLDRGNWVRPSFFHYLILLDTLRKPGGAERILAMARRGERHAMTREERA